MRDIDAIIQAVTPKLDRMQASWREHVPEPREAGRKILRATGITLVIGAVIAAILASAVPLVIALGVSLCLAPTMYNSLVLKPARQMRGIIGNEAIEAIVGVMEPQMRYSPHQGVSVPTFVASSLFRTPDRYKSEDGLSGRVGQTDLLLSEVHAEQKHESRDSKGRRQVYYTTIFRGIFMVADFHKHFIGTTRVLPDSAERWFGGLGRALQGFRPLSSQELVYLEDPEFEKQFVVYSTDQVEARYILSTSMARRILELRQRWGDDVRVAFVNSHVYLAITHSQAFLDPEVEQGTLSREQLTQVVSELAMCFDLVDELNLNTRIWTKE
jgi:hypothetical protein